MDTSEQQGGTFRGMPQTSHSALTPEGQIEQAAKLATGWVRPRSGWRRAVFRSGIVFMAVLAVGVLSLVIYSHTSR